jgi:hypothetical protein
MTTVIGKSQELSAMTIKVALQFPDSNILNHRIIAASFVKKGSQTRQAIRNDGFFVVRQ